MESVPGAVATGSQLSARSALGIIVTRSLPLPVLTTSLFENRFHLHCSWKQDVVLQMNVLVQILLECVERLIESLIADATRCRLSRFLASISHVIRSSGEPGCGESLNATAQDSTDGAHVWLAGSDICSQSLSLSIGISVALIQSGRVSTGERLTESFIS